jgi:uracil-DNA glycosylase family 4
VILPYPVLFEPEPNCQLCPRLSDFRNKWRSEEPGWFNAPVPSFGNLDAQLLIVGLAPGLRGANRTGRPFTGDFAGDLLYATLQKFDFSRGEYLKSCQDKLTLVNCRITNAVRCVPPQNKPTGPEIANCRDFLFREITAMPNLRCILALGSLSHNAILTALGQKRSNYKFSHAEFYNLTDDLVLADSYHCSRYNTNTRRLSTEMFELVFEKIRNLIKTKPV